MENLKKIRRRELEKLDHQAWDTIEAGYRKSSLKNIKSQYESYARFCTYYFLREFPVDSWQLVRFAQYLSNEGKSPGTVANSISTVRTLQALKGMSVPDLYDITIKLLLKGLQNMAGHVLKQAEAMTPVLLYEISKKVKYSDPREMVSFVACLVAFFLMLRKSNLVPDCMTGENGFDGTKQLQRGDVRLGRSTAIVNIKWSKTNQKGRKLQLPILPLVKKDICPIYWLNKMVTEIPGKSSDPLFMVPDRYGKKWVPLTYKIMGDNLKKWVKLVKGSDDGYSLHCLRRGGATFCFNIDITAEAIRLMGDWASDAYKRYLDMDVYKRAETMTKITKNIDRLLYTIDK